MSFGNGRLACNETWPRGKTFCLAARNTDLLKIGIGEPGAFGPNRKEGFWASGHGRHSSSAPLERDGASVVSRVNYLQAASSGPGPMPTCGCPLGQERPGGHIQGG